MDERVVTDLLEELLKGFGVRIRYEAIKQDEDAVYAAGGLCLLKGLAHLMEEDKYFHFTGGIYG